MSETDHREPTTPDSPTIVAALYRAEHAHPDKPLLLGADEELTYRAAERRSAHLARGLIALGAGKGTHVGLMYPPGAQFVVGLLAAARIGAISVPLAATSVSELRNRLAHSDVHIVLRAADALPHDEVRRLSEALSGAEFDESGRWYCPAAPQLRHVVVDGSRTPSTFLHDINEQAKTISAELLHTLEDDVDGSDPLAIIYTAEPGPAPEGFAHTHAALLANQHALRELHGAAEHDPLTCGASFSSIGGLALGLPATLVAGSPLRCANSTAGIRDMIRNTGDLARSDSAGSISVTVASGARVATAPVAADETMDQVIRRTAGRVPDRSAVVEQTSRLTYTELDSSTRDLAAVFIDAGIGKGTRVGVLLPNGTAWITIAMALTRIGAVLVPLSTMLRPPELRAQLRVASVRILVTVTEFRGRRYLDDLPTPTSADETRDAALPALRRVWTVDRLLATRPSGTAVRIVDALAEAVVAGDPLVILFTSGSRGVPKGVVHSHGSAFGAVRAGLTARCIDDTTRLNLSMPFFWVGGLGGGVLSALLAGATLITEDIPRPESTLELIRREWRTLFRGWPDQARALARRAEELGVSVPTLRPGSLEALLPPRSWARPGARANLFGMTESFGPYCGYPADTDMPNSAWGSCGRPFPGMEVRISDPADSRPVPAGGVGVIELRGPHILRGICRRADVFTPDGFYSTGDLGHLDAEGFLFYHGRADDMFKVSGATVYPREVERALRAVDGVAEALVTDVPGDHGTRVGALLVCDSTEITPESVGSQVREPLSAFTVPTVWAMLDSPDRVSRATTGKVDVADLRKILLTAQPASAAR